MHDKQLTHTNFLVKWDPIDGHLQPWHAHFAGAGQRFYSNIRIAAEELAQYMAAAQFAGARSGRCILYRREGALWIELDRTERVPVSGEMSDEIAG